LIKYAFVQILGDFFIAESHDDQIDPGVHEQNRKEHHTAGNAADAPDSDIFTLR
jgi:hypothetical protein